MFCDLIMLNSVFISLLQTYNSDIDIFIYSVKKILVKLQIKE